jgi:hypothetical protein
VAITTIDAVISDVMFVTELDGLRNFNPLTRVPGRTANLCRNPQSGQQEKYGSEDSGLRQPVGTVMKYLWHRRSLANT